MLNDIQKTAVIASIGLVLSAWIVAQSVVQVKTSANQTIAVTGSSHEMVTSDLANWTIHIANKQADRKVAYQNLKHDKKLVSDWLIQQGIQPEQISTGRMDTNTYYQRDHRGYSTDIITGYKLSQNIRVQTHDIQKIHTLSNDINELLNQGIDLESYSPQYLYTKLDDLKVRKLGEAIENAKARANSMAEHSGSHVGTIQSARMGVFQITSPHSNDVSDYGINDTSSIDKKVTAVVNVNFYLK